LNLKPWEFEELQPHEFYELLDGYDWRKRENDNNQAYFTHWIVNSFGGKVSPADILKPLRENPAEKKRTTAEELKEKFKHVL